MIEVKCFFQHMESASCRTFPCWEYPTCILKREVL